MSILAAGRFADTPLPLSRGDPSLLTAAGLLFLVAYALKIYAWRWLFAVDERPQTCALAAATGGASIVGLVLPGRCTDVVRIAIVNRYPGCPAGVRTLCLSIVVLGLIDIAGLAPLALALAVVRARRPLALRRRGSRGAARPRGRDQSRRRRRGAHRLGCRDLAGTRCRPRRPGTRVLGGVAILLYAAAWQFRTRFAPTRAAA